MRVRRSSRDFQVGIVKDCRNIYRDAERRIFEMGVTGGRIIADNGEPRACVDTEQQATQDVGVCRKGSHDQKRDRPTSPPVYKYVASAASSSSTTTTPENVTDASSCSASGNIRSAKRRRRKSLRFAAGSKSHDGLSAIRAGFDTLISGFFNSHNSADSINEAFVLAVAAGLQTPNAVGPLSSTSSAASSAGSTPHVAASELALLSRARAVETLRSLQGVRYLIKDLCERVVSTPSGRTTLLLPEGGGTTFKLQRAHLPFVYALLRFVYIVESRLYSRLVNSSSARASIMGKSKTKTAKAAGGGRGGDPSSSTGSRNQHQNQNSSTALSAPVHISLMLDTSDADTSSFDRCWVSVLPAVELKRQNSQMKSDDTTQEDDSFFEVFQLGVGTRVRTMDITSSGARAMGIIGRSASPIIEGVIQAIHEDGIFSIRWGNSSSAERVHRTQFSLDKSSLERRENWRRVYSATPAAARVAATEPCVRGVPSSPPAYVYSRHCGDSTALSTVPLVNFGGSVELDPWRCYSIRCKPMGSGDDAAGNVNENDNRRDNANGGRGGGFEHVSTYVKVPTRQQQSLNRRSISADDLFEQIDKRLAASTGGGSSSSSSSSLRGGDSFSTTAAIVLRMGNAANSLSDGSETHSGGMVYSTHAAAVKLPPALSKILIRLRRSGSSSGRKSSGIQQQRAAAAAARSS